MNCVCDSMFVFMFMHTIKYIYCIVYIWYVSHSPVLLFEIDLRHLNFACFYHAAFSARGVLGCWLGFDDAIVISFSQIIIEHGDFLYYYCELIIFFSYDWRYYKSRFYSMMYNIFTSMHSSAMTMITIVAVRINIKRFAWHTQWYTVRILTDSDIRISKKCVTASCNITPGCPNV